MWSGEFFWKRNTYITLAMSVAFFSLEGDEDIIICGKWAELIFAL